MKIKNVILNKASIKIYSCGVVPEQKGFFFHSMKNRYVFFKLSVHRTGHCYSFALINSMIPNYLGNH